MAAISFCRDPRSSRISTRHHIGVRAAITKLLRAKNRTWCKAVVSTLSEVSRANYQPKIAAAQPLIPQGSRFNNQITCLPRGRPEPPADARAAAQRC